MRFLLGVIFGYAAVTHNKLALIMSAAIYALIVIGEFEKEKSDK